MSRAASECGSDALYVSVILMYLALKRPLSVDFETGKSENRILIFFLSEVSSTFLLVMA